MTKDYELAIDVSFGFYQVDKNLVSSQTRKREVVQCRQIAMWLLNTNTRRSLNYIGGNIGGKYHATVLYAKKTVNNLIDTNKRFKDDVEQIDYQFKKLINRENKDVQSILIEKILLRIKEIMKKRLIKYACSQLQYEDEVEEICNNMILGNEVGFISAW